MEGKGREGDESLWTKEGASDGKEAVKEEFLAEGEGTEKGEQAEEGEEGVEEEFVAKGEGAEKG